MGRKKGDNPTDAFFAVREPEEVLLSPTVIRRIARRGLSRILLGDPIPQYAVVGLQEPQREVVVTLEGGGVPRRDVTRNNVVVSLRPLLLAVGFPGTESAEADRRDTCELVFREASDGAELGRIGLQKATSIPLNAGHYVVFAAVGHSDHCLGPTRRSLHYAYQWWKTRSRGEPHNFRMEFLDFLRLWTFYVCPRPVALISVQHDGSDNLFPMDLIGPTEAGYFSLALRNTSPSVELISKSRRIALSEVPVELAEAVYTLGKHHRLRNIDLTALPFEVEVSSEFRLPVPSAALGVVELYVERVHPLGSHVVFLARPVSDQRRRSGRRMFHVAGL